MDKISDFFEQLKERFTSPVFSSFLISWLLWNWKIPTTILLESKDWFAKNKFSSYVDFVLKNTNTWHSLVWPFLSAIVYCFFVKNLLSALETWTADWGTKWNLNISKKGSIKTELYMESQSELLKTLKRYEELVNEQSLFKIEKDKLHKDIEDKKTSITDLNNQIKNFRDQFRKNQLNGYWKIDYTSVFNRKNTLMFVIKDDQVLDTTDSNQPPKLLYYITYIDNDRDNGRLIIILLNTQKKKEVLFLTNYNNKVWTGTDSEGNDIRFSEVEFN